MNLVARFYDPQGGRILIDGADVRDVSLASLRTQVSFVFQETYLFSDTVAGNIAYGRPGISRGEIEAAARLAQAHEFIENLPQGYDTMLGERGASLSGGQKQRLAIARAILTNPRILVLDDATASVDPETEDLIRRATRFVMHGRTTFVIAHRISTVKQADVVIVVENGRITQVGTHEQLMLTEGHYREIAEVQLYGDTIARDAEGHPASHMDRVQNPQAVAADVAEVGRGMMARWAQRLKKAPAAAQALAIAAPPLSADDEQEAQYRPIDLALGRRMLGLLAPYRWKFAFGLLLGMLMVAAEMHSPKFMEALVNHLTAYVGEGTSDTARPTYVTRFAAWIARTVGVSEPVAGPRNAMTVLVITIVLWAMVLACALVLQRFTILVMTGAGERVQFGIRKRLFAHLQRLSMSYYDKTKLGRIISRCTSDVSSMREINVWGLYTIFANLLMMLFAAVMLASTDTRLFLAVLPLGVLMYVLNRVYLKRSAAMNQVAREGWTRVSTNLAENITGMRVVAAFNRQEPNLDVFNRLQVQNTENNVRLSRLNGVYQPLVQAIGFAGQIIILTYGAYLVVVGRLEVGAVVASFMFWSVYFINPILNFAQFYNTLLMAMAGAERIFNLLDLAPDVQDEPGAEPLPRIVGSVRFEHVTFGYDPARPVLHDIDFEAEPGQTVALVGATGSGKSSIVSLIARFYQPQQGRVLVDGHDIRHVTGDSLHRQMGLVLQVNYLFTGTVMENIRYAIPGATDDDVVNAARAIGSYDTIAALKDGFQTDVGERGANMSLGQRQLICFTRAFLADPRIFMLDEATSAVDTHTEQFVQSSLEKLLAGRTTFIVAHRLSTIMRADNIFVIDAGRIVERGTHRELLAAGGKYANLYRQFVDEGS